MKLTDEELEALQDYTGSGYLRVNDCLRGDDDSDDAVERTIAALDSAIAKAISSEDMTVYRGYDTRVASYLSNHVLKLGSVVTEPAFTSTSRTEIRARAFAEWPDGLVVRIKIPAGSNALDVSPYSVNPDEDEILLPRGSSLKVVGYDKLTKVIDAEVVSNG